MKKGIMFLGGAAAGFLFIILAAELFFIETPSGRDEHYDNERRIAE